MFILSVAPFVRAASDSQSRVRPWAAHCKLQNTVEVLYGWVNIFQALLLFCVENALRHFFFTTQWYSQVGTQTLFRILPPLDLVDQLSCQSAADQVVLC